MNDDLEATRHVLQNFALIFTHAGKRFTTGFALARRAVLIMHDALARQMGGKGTPRGWRGRVGLPLKQRFRQSERGFDFSVLRGADCTNGHTGLRALKIFNDVFELFDLGVKIVNCKLSTTLRATSIWQ